MRNQSPCVEDMPECATWSCAIHVSQGLTGAAQAAQAKKRLSCKVSPPLRPVRSREGTLPSSATIPSPRQETMSERREGSRNRKSKTKHDATRYSENATEPPDWDNASNLPKFYISNREYRISHVLIEHCLQQGSGIRFGTHFPSWNLSLRILNK